MFKRTKGYLLLIMLVLTGLAGRIHSNTLTGKERRHLISGLKNCKETISKNLEELSPRQINFRPSKKDPSIRDCIYQLATVQNDLWTLAQSSLKQKQDQQARNSFTDENLQQLAQIQNPHDIITTKPAFKTIEDALSLVDKDRAALLRYLKTTTEDVREHKTQISLGVIDVYQVLLLHSVYTNYYLDKIKAIKSNRHFPK
jgi:hypothetical protein